MKVAAHQLLFMPWSGFWIKALLADFTVIMTHMRMEKGTPYSRTQLENGWMTLDRLPGTDRIDLAQVHPLSVRKMLTRLDHEVWPSKAKYGEKVRHGFQPALTTLHQLSRGPAGISLQWINHLFLSSMSTVLADIGSTNFVFAPWYEPDGDSKSRRLMQFLRTVVPFPDEFEYLSGPGGLEYMRTDRAEGKGFPVAVHCVEYAPNLPKISAAQLIAFDYPRFVDLVGESRVKLNALRS
jgi:hypothetical protein